MRSLDRFTAKKNLTIFKKSDVITGVETYQSNTRTLRAKLGQTFANSFFSPSVLSLAVGCASL